LAGVALTPVQFYTEISTKGREKPLQLRLPTPAQAASLSERHLPA